MWKMPFLSSGRKRITHEKPNTISVDDIREQLVGDVQIKPYQSKYKIYIVPDAEKMNVQAQNALLKTIEEPPAYAVILFLTTNASSFLPTILSRCVVLNMKPVPDQEVRRYLMEHVEVPDYQADIAVAFAQGNIGKAVKLATSEYFNEIKNAALHILKNAPRMDISEISAAVKGISEYKVDIQDYLDIMAVWYRDVLYFKATRDADGIIFRDQLVSIQEQTSNCSYEGAVPDYTGEHHRMIKIIGVRFRNAGKIYYFDPKKLPVKKGDHVIVETARGIEYGSVVADPRDVTDDQVVQPLKPVIRIANADDHARAQRNKEKEKEAFRICLEKIHKHKLEMKLIDTEYTFDNNKVLFYFTADGRIDFRELVKDLASVFKTRIELRQIGVRDETKIVGGVGICGRELCCHTFLSEFAPVSIKMAKEQNLSLNPTKISGVCGRLMCCLKNEEDTYEYLNSRLPGIGDRVVADDGLKGEVQSVNVLRQLVKVIVDVQDEKEIREYKVEQLKFKPRRKKEKLNLNEKELKELKALEKDEGKSKLDDN